MWVRSSRGYHSRRVFHNLYAAGQGGYGTVLVVPVTSGSVKHTRLHTLGVGLGSDRRAMGLLSTRVLEVIITLHSIISQHMYSQLS